MDNITIPASMMRLMTFHFSHSVPGGLLFASWRVESVGDLIGAIVASFILALLYEGLKTFREYLIYWDYIHWRKYSKKSSPTVSLSDKSSLIISEQASVANNQKGFRYYSISLSMHFLQSAMHVVQVGYGYILMLIIMTFNGWLFLAVCFGAGVGYLAFAKSRHLTGHFTKNNEQLQ